MRRQIARLLEPSLQCARFIYDELVKVLFGVPSCYSFKYLKSNCDWFRRISCHNVY